MPDPVALRVESGDGFVGIVIGVGLEADTDIIAVRQSGEEPQRAGEGVAQRAAVGLEGQCHAVVAHTVSEGLEALDGSCPDRLIGAGAGHTAGKNLEDLRPQSGAHRGAALNLRHLGLVLGALLVERGVRTDADGLHRSRLQTFNEDGSL